MSPNEPNVRVRTASSFIPCSTAVQRDLASICINVQPIGLTIHFYISNVTELAQQEWVFIWLAQYTDFYNTGEPIGPVVWNKCAVGELSFSASWFGVPCDWAYYTCAPGSRTVSALGC